MYNIYKTMTGANSLAASYKSNTFGNVMVESQLLSAACMATVGSNQSSSLTVQKCNGSSAAKSSRSMVQWWFCRRITVQRLLLPKEINLSDGFCISYTKQPTYNNKYNLCIIAYKTLSKYDCNPVARLVIILAILTVSLLVLIVAYN